MKYNFIIANHVFVIHSDFDIPWEEWHKNYIYKEIPERKFPVTNYYVSCFIIPPDVSSYKELYHSDVQTVYQGPFGEIRAHFLINQSLTILCEERGNEYYIQIDYRLMYEAYMYLVAMMLEKVLLNDDALILHSSYIQYDGKAILFSGPSGIGKSTQADLWVQYRNAELINGDRTLLKRDNCLWSAKGFPICGTSKTAKNKEFPISSIVFLEQDTSNHIVQLQGFIAFKKLLSEVSINYWNGSACTHALQLIEDISANIPIYLLSCTPTLEAVNRLAKEIL